MKKVEDSLLGKETAYDHDYDPALLYPIARADNRNGLPQDQVAKFQGEDLWTAYELSWLLPNGKPQVAVAEFRIPADSPKIIESKSFKLYLNSLNQTAFETPESLETTLKRDLSAAAGAPVGVHIMSLRDHSLTISETIGKAICLDDLDADRFVYTPDAGLLKLINDEDGETVEETLYSDLLRSNCPVTGQPDWGSVFISYRGPRIDHASLLQYLVSFRQCQDFHEHCVERIFCDVVQRCACESLSVYARYTRRGGLDINPYRATRDYSEKAATERLVRQ